MKTTLEFNEKLEQAINSEDHKSDLRDIYHQLFFSDASYEKQMEILDELFTTGYLWGYFSGKNEL